MRTPEEIIDFEYRLAESSGLFDDSGDENSDGSDDEDICCCWPIYHPVDNPNVLWAAFFDGDLDFDDFDDDFAEEIYEQRSYA